MSSSVNHLSIIRKRDDWETPKNIFTEACVNYHIKPEIDVCATLETSKCDLYFGPDHDYPDMRDALTRPWEYDFFMNAPYSRIEEFMDYAFDQIWNYRVHGLMLAYSKTDTKWWHKHIEGNPLVKTHFVQGRIQFLLNGIIPLTCKDCKKFYDEPVTLCECGCNRFMRNSSPYPSVWIVVKIPK